MNWLKSKAVSFSRSPLGIIALCLVFIDGFSSIVLGFGTRQLDDSLIWSLAIFIMLYAVLVVVIFYILVTRHHDKIFGPENFRTERGFLAYIRATPAEKERQVLKEAEELSGVAEKQAGSADDGGEVKRVIQGSKSQVQEAFQAVPMAKAQQIVRLAEELALRKYESGGPGSIKRNVMVSMPGFRGYVDGVLPVLEGYFLINVKYCHASLPDSVISKLLELGFLHSRLPVTFILLVVSETLSGDDCEIEATRIHLKFLDVSATVDVQVYNFAELKKQFGVSSSD